MLRLLPVFFLGGCLLNFSSFDEDEFLQSYESSLCDIYMDCLDGTPDGNINTSNIVDQRNSCIAWVRTSKEQGCPPQSEEALACYDELQDLVQEIEQRGECGLLWADNSLESCRLTYLDCPNDAPFGTVPDADPLLNDPPTVTSISPLHGPDSGGTLVELTGTGFDDQSIVQFGGLHGSIEFVTETSISVVTPPGSTGNVNINVTNKNGNTVLDEPYQYWEDIRGYTALIGIYRYQKAVGGYWSGDDNMGGLIALATQSNPQSYFASHIFGVEPYENGCIFYDPTESTYGASIIQQPGYSQIEVRSSLGSTALYVPTGGSGYYGLAEFESTIDANRSYSLHAAAENGWPALDLTNVANGPQSVSLSTPNIATTSSYVPRIEKDNFKLGWSKQNGDYLLIRLMESQSDPDYISCAFTEDAPSPVIPESLLNTHHAGNPELYLEVCRVDSNNGNTLPLNNGSIVFSVMNCIVGKVRLDEDATE